MTVGRTRPCTPRGSPRAVARRLVACLLLGVGWLATLPAAADTVAADVLYQEAKLLVEAGKYAEGCPKFQASLELDRQLGTLISLAYCEEQLGKLATAWVHWGEAQQWAKQRKDRRTSYVVERRHEVEARLPKLVVVVERPVAGLQVVRDGVPLPATTHGVAIPVDPGEHQLTVARGDEVLEQRSFTAVEAQTVQVRFDLTAIAERHPAASPEPEPSAAGEPKPAQPPPEPAVVVPPSDDGQTQRTVGWIVGAVGAAALLTAGGLEIAALVKKGQAEEADRCVNKFCAPQGIDAADSARTFAEAGQWVGIAGLATLAIGATLLLTAPQAKPAAPSSARLAVVPWMGPDSLGVVLGGQL